MSLSEIMGQIDGHDLRADGYDRLGFTLTSLDREITDGVPSYSGQLESYTFQDELIQGLPPVQLGGVHVIDAAAGTFEMAGSQYQMLGTDGFGTTPNSFGGIVFARASTVFPPDVAYYASRIGHLPLNGAGRLFDTTATYAYNACFGRGTRLNGIRGQVAVEDLLVGDLLLTADGSHQPVRWIGRSEVNFGDASSQVERLPYAIAAGAFGPDMPARDLLMSGNHAVRIACVDYHLVELAELANGRTIRQNFVDTIEYWHVELDEHCVIFAEGLPVESYRDTGNRALFASPQRGASRAHQEPCLPYLDDEFVLPTVRHRLNSIADHLGWHAIWRDPLPWLMVDGERQDPQRTGSLLTFVIPAGAKSAHLCAEPYVPAHILGGDDHRRLGILVTGIALGDVHGPLSYAGLGEDGLINGGYGSEVGPGGAQRWFGPINRINLSKVDRHKPCRIVFEIAPGSICEGARTLKAQCVSRGSGNTGSDAFAPATVAANAN